MITLKNFLYADTLTENILRSYFDEAVLAIVRFMAVIAQAEQAGVFTGGTTIWLSGYVERLGGINEYLETTTRHTGGLVDRELALMAASRAAAVADGATTQIGRLQREMADTIKVEADRADRAKKRAEEAAEWTKRQREQRQEQRQKQQERDNQRQQERNNQNDYTYTRSSSMPQGVEQWALDMIEALGYRAAALQNHPDRGGSHEKSVAINVARDYMKSAGLL